MSVAKITRAIKATILTRKQASTTASRDTTCPNVADVLKEGENNSSIVQWWHDVSRVRVPSLLHATTYLSIELQECADWLENKYQNIRDFLGV